jgi:hypothetical protein
LRKQGNARLILPPTPRAILNQANDGLKIVCQVPGEYRPVACYVVS